MTELGKAHVESFVISTAGLPAIIPINSTDVMFIDARGNSRTHRFDGTNWVQIAPTKAEAKAWLDRYSATPFDLRVPCHEGHEECSLMEPARYCLGDIVERIFAGDEPNATDET